MTTSTITHDSHTCTLNSGGPCEMCAAANEYEARQTAELNLDHNHTQRILTALSNDKRFASLTTIRAAIADVVDAGWQRGEGCDLKHPWRFPTEMFDGAEQPTDDDLLLREKFLDAVCQRIAELQAAPHNLDSQYHDYCSGYADGWAAAHTESLREQKEDMR